MTKFLQIVLLIAAVLWLEANGKPLFQGISFQRGFEINFKPLPRNPITFIKEKWSPFGVFGRKHSMQKRYSGSSDVPEGEASPVGPRVSREPEHRPAAPVFEHIEETEHLRTSPLITLPYQTPRSVIPMPTTVIVTPVPHPVFNYMPPPSMTPEVVSIPPNNPITSDVLLQPPFVRMEGALPPTSSNMVISSSSGRFTDITRAGSVREYMNSIEPIPPALAVEEKAAPPLETNSIKPESPKNDIVKKENSVVRGSKLALHFGSIFLQLMSQFMSNARATFDQMTNPPPVFNN